MPTRLLRGSRWLLIASVVLLGLVSTTDLLVPLMIRYGIDSGVARRNVDTVLIAVLACAALVPANWCANAAARTVTGRACERAIFQLRTHTAEHALRLPMRCYEGEERQDVVTMMTADINTVSDFLRDDVLGSATDVVSFAGMVIALVCTSGVALIVFGAGLLLILGALVLTRRRFAPLYVASRTYVIEFIGGLREAMSQLWVLQAFGRQESSRRRIELANDQYRTVRTKTQLVNAIYFPAIDLLGVVAVTATIFLGSRLISTGQVTVGLVVALILYLNRIFATVQRFSQIYDGYKRTEVSLRRLGDFLRLPPERNPDESAAVPANRPGRIAFADVTMRFPGHADPVLGNVTLPIEAGETVAIVGETGAGKSTLAKLMLGFHTPTAGTVTIDGLAVSAWPLRELRRSVGYIPQVPFLFDGSIRDNIAYSCPHAEQAAIAAAVRRVGGDEMIRRLPDGDATVVGERGAALSSGQRQMVSLARMELMDPRVVVLDEATAQLDGESGTRYLAAVRALSRNRSTILIAHHLPAVMWADRVVVLDNGEIRESGTHESLLRADGEYARMWRNANVGIA